MPQSDHPARRSAPHGPKRRGDSTRPAATRPGRSVERRPYPTASTTTRVSPAKPGSPRARSGSRESAPTSASTSTPATVWTAGTAPIDLDAHWPAPIVEKIVGTFSEPRGRVALLPWPTVPPTVPPSPGDRPRLAPVFSDGAPDHDSGAGSHDGAADALAVVEGLHRRARVVRVPVAPAASAPGSRPFWADLVSNATTALDGSPATVVSPSRSDLGGGVLDSTEAVLADTDLIITSLRSEDGGDHTSDLVALAAARLLRVGGILAVVTHCDWLAGDLIDPTGAVVAAAQNADLLYLQHIVALHVPMREGRFAVEPLVERGGTAIHGEVTGDQVRAAHRAAVRGLPAPHRRIHSDVLVFAQPHAYEPLSVSPSEQAPDTGDIR